MWSIFDRIQDIDGLSSSEDPEVTRRKRVGFRKEIIGRSLNAKNDNFQQKTKLAKVDVHFQKGSRYRSKNCH